MSFNNDSSPRGPNLFLYICIALFCAVIGGIIALSTAPLFWNDASNAPQQEESVKQESPPPYEPDAHN